MTSELILDGSHGEGGGQIVRSALALSALTGRPLRIDDIRARRRNPGLAAQHLVAARAAATLCGAELSGDELGSPRLRFVPASRPAAGQYRFDVASGREGGSAGSAPLVLQTVFLPLLLASGDSVVEIAGGTHAAWSPTVDYLQQVWLPSLRAMGAEAELELEAWGFYPAGGGVIRCRIAGKGGAPLQSLRRLERGELRAIRGQAVAANLPSHIPQRMTERATSLLRSTGYGVQIEPRRVRAVCPGAVLTLVAELDAGPAGFTALGERGKPSETVAEEAVARLLDFLGSGAAVDLHLADQLLLPAAFAAGESAFTTERVTRHLRTNAWVIERFGVARVEVEGREGEPGRVAVHPIDG